jgi:cell division protein FtsL
MEIIMLDLAAGFEDRNYGLRRSTDLRILLKPLVVVFPFLAVAGSLFLYLWVGGQNIQTGYQLQRLQLKETELLNVRRQIIIEEQILKNPEKLNAMAQADLGMFLLQPNQIIPASYEHEDSENREKFSGNLGSSSEPLKNITFNGL